MVANNSQQIYDLLKNICINNKIKFKIMLTV